MPITNTTIRQEIFYFIFFSLKIIITSVFLFSTTIVFCQKNSIRLNLNDFMHQSTKFSYDDSIEHDDNKQYFITPSLGYYRILDNSIGFGCEIGYSVKNVKNNTSVYLSTTDTGFNKYINKAEGFYICPTIFEIYSWHKYQLITSLTVPLTYAYKIESSQSTIRIDKVSNNTIFSKNITNQYAKQLLFGAFINVGFYRKIYKNIYVGPQIGFGFSGRKYFGKDTYTQKINDSGNITTTIDVLDYKKNIFIYSDFRTTLSVYYNF